MTPDREPTLTEDTPATSAAMACIGLALCLLGGDMIRSAAGKLRKQGLTVGDVLADSGALSGLTDQGVELQEPEDGPEDPDGHG